MTVLSAKTIGHPSPFSGPPVPALSVASSPALLLFAAVGSWTPTAPRRIDLDHIFLPKPAQDVIEAAPVLGQEIRESLALKPPAPPRAG